MEKLSKEQLSIITSEVIKNLDHEKRKRVTAEKDSRLRNTRILVRSYPKLKAHTATQPEVFLDDDIYEMITGVKISDHELARYHIKTKHLLEYVDTILAAYKQVCLGGDESDKRRWQIMYDTYLSDHRLRMADQANKWNVDKSTISRECAKAIQELSVTMFGIAGLADFLSDWIA